MKISYKKLRHLMVDRNISRIDLAHMAGISAPVAGKLQKDEPVAVSVLLRLCEALNCDIGDIAEAVPDNQHINPEREEKE